MQNMRVREIETEKDQGQLKRLSSLMRGLSEPDPPPSASSSIMLTCTQVSRIIATANLLIRHLALPAPLAMALIACVVDVSLIYAE
jgi:hypothetical protein